MARTVLQIYNQSVQNYAAACTAAGLVDPISAAPLVNPAEWSDYDLQQLIIFNCSMATAIFEQLFDSYVSQTEALIASAAPQTAPWIQNLCLNLFQYNSATPQVPQLDIAGNVAYAGAPATFAPYYPNINAAYRIITQCAVVPGIFGTTTVKVAKGGTSPVALISAELYSLQSFLNLLTVPGINVNATSGNPDNIYIGATATYSGAYSAIIQSTVVAAIINYLQSIPASGVAGINSVVGVMKLTDLIAIVRAVPGVIDFELQNVNARTDSTAFTPGTYNLVSGYDWLNTNWNSGLNGSGYMVTETTTGYDINSSITYIPA